MLNLDIKTFNDAFLKCTLKRNKNGFWKDNDELCSNIIHFVLCCVLPEVFTQNVF